MIGRADIEGSKSDVAMNAWPPQASYPCGNFSDTSRLKFTNIAHPRTKGSIGHSFKVCIHTEDQNQGSFYPFVLRQISVLAELPFGRLRYLFTNEPPQPNSPFDNVLHLDPAPQRRGGFRLGVLATRAKRIRDETEPRKTQQGFYPPTTPGACPLERHS